MRTAIIAPTGLIYRYCRTGYHLALAHLVLENNDYRNAYANFIAEGDDVILDNSVIELGRPVPIEDILKAAFKINAKEIVLRDVPFNASMTIAASTEMAQALGRTKLDLHAMAVPQGRSVMEWFECYDALCELEEVKVIGIPKSLREDRSYVCAQLNESRDKAREYHLLGTWGNPIEVKELSQYDWLRGVDSKIPVRAGQQGIAFHPASGLLADRENMATFDFDDSTDYMPVVTQHNVRLFTQWAAGQKTGEVIPLARRNTTP